jgi:small conductance mechanosensitive channel
MADLSFEKIAQNPALLEKHFGQAVETGMAVIATYSLKMIGAIMILIIGWIVSGMVRDAIINAGRRAPRVDITIFTFVASVAKYAVLVFTVVAMLASFGVQTTSFVAVLGAMGLAIGLALQGALGHVAAGLMLVIFRPFRVGDNVETAGVAGVVTEISLFTTEICTADNIMIVIPNSAIWAGVIKNFSGHQKRKIGFEVGLAYATPIEEAMTVVREIIGADKRVLAEPPPLVAVSRLTDTAVMLLVEVWVANAAFAPVRFDLNKHIKEAFERKGVALPAAARQIYVASNPAVPNGNGTAPPKT